MPKSLYYVHDAGGLCNRLFPFAHALSFAQAENYQLYNLVFGAYSKYFVGTNTAYISKLEEEFGRDFVFPRYDFPAWKNRFRLAKKLTPSKTITLGDDELLELADLPRDGHLKKIQWVNALYIFNNSAFFQYADKIRNFFCPIPEEKSIIDRYLERARDGVETLVGVHIRQGDYKTHSNGLLFFESSEYRQLMDRMREQLPNKSLRFLICSDTSQNPAMFDGLDCVSGIGTELGDLYSLAGCDFLIGPASTYSEWASFYGNVPRFVHNRKYEELYGLDSTPLSVSAFKVHCRGYGKFCEGENK